MLCLPLRRSAFAGNREREREILYEKRLVTFPPKILLRSNSPHCSSFELCQSPFSLLTLPASLSVGPSLTLSHTQHLLFPLHRPSPSKRHTTNPNKRAGFESLSSSPSSKATVAAAAVYFFLPFLSLISHAHHAHPASDSPTTTSSSSPTALSRMLHAVC